ncbi:MAG: GNAT family N-acetyltransferase [Chlamydiales bacterium]|nr:GNAT family N-acetyltransferase [Chlamydiales bacterium]
MISIRKAVSIQEICACYSIMRQLRPHLAEETAFIAQIQRQLTQGYHLAYCQEKDTVKAVAGFRFLEFLAWGKVLYIDDLVTDSNLRKNGFGTHLLTWLIDQAKNAKCDQVHLDSGPQRHDAHRLYLNQDFKITCHHFALDLKD